MSRLPIVYASGLHPAGISIRFRKLTGGPEELVIDQFLSHHGLRPRSCGAVFVLREPAIGNLNPDLLILEFDPSTLSLWKKLPMLSLDECKLLHLVVAGAHKKVQLQNLLSTPLASALRRLLEAEVLIYTSRSGIRLKQGLPRVPVRRVIAVEAKTSLRPKLIAQAITNLHFSSHSVLLTPGNGRDQATEIGLERITPFQNSWHIYRTPCFRKTPSPLYWRLVSQIIPGAVAERII